MTIFISVIFILIGHSVRLLGLNALLRNYGKLKLPSAINGYCIGFIGNLIFPLRLGDVFRAIFFARRLQTSRSLLLMVVVLERTIDLMILTIFLGVTNVVISVNTVVLLCMALIGILLLGLASFIPDFLAYLRMKTALLDDRLALNIYSAGLLVRSYLRRLSIQDLAIATFWLMVSFGSYAMAFNLLSSVGLSSTAWTTWLRTSSFSGLLSSVDWSDKSGSILLVLILAQSLVLLVLTIFSLLSSRNGENSSQQRERLRSFRGLDRWFESKDVNRSALGSRSWYRNVLKQHSTYEAVFVGGSGAILLKPSSQDVIDEHDSLVKYWHSSNRIRAYDQIGFMQQWQLRYRFPHVLEVAESRQFISCKMEYLNDFIVAEKAIHALSDVPQITVFAEQWMTSVLAGTHINSGDIVDMDRNTRGLWTNKMEFCLEALNLYAPEFTTPHTFIVNGKSFPNLQRVHNELIEMNNFFSFTFPARVVHGDVTLSNTFVRQTELGFDFRFIDPNPAQPSLGIEVDLGKMLQSTQARYEDLCAVRNSDIVFDGHHLQYPVVNSSPLVQLNRCLRTLFRSIDPRLEMISLMQCYSHLLRVIPYRLANDRHRLPLFIASAVSLGTEIIDEFDSFS